MNCRFSIVIPTRNRAALLTHAIESVLGQEFDDYEIIVSNNNSCDNTEPLVGSYGDHKIKYYKTERTMSMVEHWEFALDKASGEWILFLCDDDALLPDSLAYLDESIREHGDVRVVQYSRIMYVYQDGVESNGNYLRFKMPVLDSAERRDSVSRMRLVFRRMSDDMPKFLNAVVSMKLVKEIRSKYSQMFHNWAPDYTSGILLLAHTEDYLYIRKPLRVYGKNLLSYGAGSRINPDHLLEYLSEFQEFDGQFQYSPFPELMTVHNGVYDTLCRTRRLLETDYGGLEVDRAIFYHLLLNDIRQYVDNGYAEYAKYVQRIKNHVRSMPASMRASFMKRRFVNLGKRILQRRLRVQRMGFRNMRGDGEYAFKNIYEAGEAFSQWLESTSR